MAYSPNKNICFVCQTYTGKKGFRTALNIFTWSRHYREISVRNSICVSRVVAASDKQRILRILCGQVKKGNSWLWMLKPPVLTWMEQHVGCRLWVTVLKSCPPLKLYALKSPPRTRLYLTPVRDEEAESQRKAKSRHARQTRRSTQVKRRGLDRAPAIAASPLTLNWCEAAMWLSCRVWLWQSWKRPRGPTTCLLQTGTQKKEPLQKRAVVWWKAWQMTEEPK